MHEKDRRPSTVGDYRNTVRRYLLPAFGADTLLHTFDAAHVDAYRERLLVEGQLSRWTIQKILVLLHGILKRAEREGWIAANPAADAERRTPAWAPGSARERHADQKTAERTRERTDSPAAAGRSRRRIHRP